MSGHRHSHESPADAPPAPLQGRASGTAMAALVRDLIGALDEDGRRGAMLPFEDGNRFDWNYIPRRRPGLPVRAMRPDARAALDLLLRFALSEAGYEKASGIMALEEPLGLIESRTDYRDPLNYSLTLFGEPDRGPWGWRLEGHHLSLNFTGHGERLFGVTPAFLGSNPAQVPPGVPMAGHRVLGAETDLAFALVRGLDDRARAKAVLQSTSFGNILSGPGREDSLKQVAGLPLAAMPESGRSLAVRLLEIYARNFRPELAEGALARMREAGLDEVSFAWAGPTGGKQPHYWRLHGPVTLIEFDNTQNDANHIHSVWHDLRHEFGGDLLRRHYEHGPHRHG
jgi:hypothetical protein